MARRFKELRGRGQQLAARLPNAKELTEQERAVFHSNWYYTAVHLLSSIPGTHDVDSLADQLQLPKRLIAEVRRFLLSTVLCIETDGCLTMGPQRTHTPKESPPYQLAIESVETTTAFIFGGIRFHGAKVYLRKRCAGSFAPTRKFV